MTNVSTQNALQEIKKKTKKIRITFMTKQMNEEWIDPEQKGDIRELSTNFH